MDSDPLPVDEEEEEEELAEVDVVEGDELGRSPLSFEYLRRRLRKSLLDLANTRSLLGSKTRMAFMMRR